MCKVRNDCNCPIWQTPAKIILPPNPPYEIISSRAGGQYFITEDAYMAAKQLSPEEQNLVTSWLFEQRKKGDCSPEISSETLDIARKLSLPSPTTRADNLLRYLCTKGGAIGTFVKFNAVDNTKALETKDQLLVWTASLAVKEVIWLVKVCSKKGWIEHQCADLPGSIPLDTVHEISLTLDGHKRGTKPCGKTR